MIGQADKEMPWNKRNCMRCIMIDLTTQLALSYSRTSSLFFNISAQRRAIFDQYGEKGLKEGTSNGKGGRAGGYTFKLNPEELFAEHFGSTSPFADFFASEHKTNNPNDALFKSYQPTEVKKVPPQEINFYVSLEELYGGASKSQKVIRKRLGMDGRTLTLEEKIFTIELGAGWKENTRITFAKEGDEFPGELNEPGDIIFLLKTKPHPRFTRKGSDLIYTANLTLLQALTGTTIEIETLDHRIIPIGLNEVATPTGSKVVPGEGLPNPKTGVKGNLIIQFNITFPQQLTTDQKNQIKKVLTQ